MCVLPTHHVNGLIVTLVTPLLAGASTVLCRAFKTGEFWRTIDEERVHVVSVVPTLLAFVVTHRRRAAHTAKRARASAEAPKSRSPRRL